MSNINFDPKKASHYEDLARKAVFGYDQLFTMVLSLLAENQNETANVMVVGCGTGMELMTFGKHMLNWQLTGVDPSEEMIKIAKANIDYNGLNNRITLYNGLVDSLPEEERYDAATLIFVLRFITGDREKLSLFKHIAKRLRTGAKFVLVDQYGDPNSDYFQELFKAWKNFMKLSGVPSDLATKIAAQSTDKSFFLESRIIELLSEAGFTNAIRFYNSFMYGGWVVQKGN